MSLRVSIGVTLLIVGILLGLGVSVAHQMGYVLPRALPWIAGAIAVAGFASLWSGGAGPAEAVRVDDIPQILEALFRSKDDSYALFLFNPRDSADEVAFQFSIMRGVAGLDWFRAHRERRRRELLYQRNEADLAAFVTLARKSGFDVTPYDGPIPYVRAEGKGSLPELANAILVEMYGLKPTDGLRLESDGFTWKGSPTTG